MDMSTEPVTNEHDVVVMVRLTESLEAVESTDGFATCLICLEPIEPGTSAKSRGECECGVNVHRACLDECSKFSDRCLICRQPLASIRAARIDAFEHDSASTCTGLAFLISLYLIVFGLFVYVVVVYYTLIRRGSIATGWCLLVGSVLLSMRLASNARQPNEPTPTVVVG